MTTIETKPTRWEMSTKTTLAQFINLIYSPDKPIYFYEEEPDTDDDGNDDFSGLDLFLAFQSSFKPNGILLPKVCERIVSQIYFCGDGIIRVVLDEENRGQE